MNSKGVNTAGLNDLKGVRIWELFVKIAAFLSNSHYFCLTWFLAFSLSPSILLSSSFLLSLLFPQFCSRSFWLSLSFPQFCYLSISSYFLWFSEKKKPLLLKVFAGFSFFPPVQGHPRNSPNQLNVAFKSKKTHLYLPLIWIHQFLIARKTQIRNRLQSCSKISFLHKCRTNFKNYMQRKLLTRCKIHCSTLSGSRAIFSYL